MKKGKNYSGSTSKATVFGGGNSENLTELWSEYAGETIIIDPTMISGVIKAYASKEGCEKLKEALNGKGRIKRSQYLRSWYYASK